MTIGGAPEDVARLRRLRELGAARVNVTLPAEGAAQIIPVPGPLGGTYTSATGLTCTYRR